MIEQGTEECIASESVEMPDLTVKFAQGKEIEEYIAEEVVNDINLPETCTTEINESKLGRPRVNVVKICEIPRKVKSEKPINVSQLQIKPTGDVSGELKSHARQRKVMGSNLAKRRNPVLRKSRGRPPPKPPDKQINLGCKMPRNPMHFQHMGPLLSFTRCKIMIEKAKWF